uniref:Trihelix transcription factor GT-2-like n=1 Tax=Cicer arietinum TaxID=3827 RepID=A0A1S2Y096_CICAR|nr:trihelix transcription factor GT-2-like [Cicer arietinum]
MMGESAIMSGGGEGGDAVAVTGSHNMTAEVVSGGGVGSNSGSDIERGRIEEGERSFGGNRWPRQETLALLRIRSDMDITFRDASVKGPLWDEVSRKLAELGYNRSAKKCKEKFENVYKYHKRTKDGRGGKSDGKTYRFFDQLEALDHIHNHPSTHQPQNLLKQPQSTPTLSQVITTSITETATMPQVVNTTLSMPHATVPSISMPQNNIVTTQAMNVNITTIPSNPSTSFQPSTTNPPQSLSFPNIPTDLLSNSMVSSYSTSSDDTMEGTQKRKRKWKDFFEKLMKEVIEKQEQLHKRFLEAIEKREHDRMVREEAWRAQEMQRINREREILAQERSITAAKDAAVMSLLQKIAQQPNLGHALNNINVAQPLPPQQSPQQQPPPSKAPTSTPAPTLVAQVINAPPPVQPPPVTPSGPPMVQQQQQIAKNMEIVKFDNNGDNSIGASSSRWPKVEVQALINLRTELDNKYQENGPKGPLWEEISSAMKNLGYNRNPKRCKEKWENINKYFKKVKESNKKRPEDSKTCPYFHQLDALYKEKNKAENSGGGSSQPTNAESMVAPLMVQPEQQWPPQQEGDPMERNRRDEEDDMDEDDKDGEEEDDEEMDEGGGGGSNFEIVANKPSVGA